MASCSVSELLFWLWRAAAVLYWTSWCGCCPWGFQYTSGCRKNPASCGESVRSLVLVKQGCMNDSQSGRLTQIILTSVPPWSAIRGMWLSSTAAPPGGENGNLLIANRTETSQNVWLWGCDDCEFTVMACVTNFNTGTWWWKYPAITTNNTSSYGGLSIPGIK